MISLLIYFTILEAKYIEELNLSTVIGSGGEDYLANTITTCSNRFLQ